MYKADPPSSWMQTVNQPSSGPWVPVPPAAGPFWSPVLLWSHPCRHTPLPCSQATSPTCWQVQLDPCWCPHTHLHICTCSGCCTTDTWTSRPWSRSRGWCLHPLRCLQMFSPRTGTLCAERGQASPLTTHCLCSISPLTTLSLCFPMLVPPQTTLIPPFPYLNFYP